MAPTSDRTPTTDALPANGLYARGGRRGFIRACAAGAALLIGAAGVLGLGGMAPEPDPVPRRWELQVEPGDMRVVSVDVPGAGPRKFFYMTYHVVNNSGQDVLLAPSFELSDGEGHVARSGRDVPQAAIQSITAATQNSLVQDQVSIIGELRQGEENAKDGLVIWSAENLKPQQVTVYAAGFSGETKTVASPDGKEKFVLRKTLRIEYNAPGDLTGSAPIILGVAAKSWIMR